MPQVALLGIFAPARSLPGPVGRLEVAEATIVTDAKGWQSFSFMKEFPDESWWHWSMVRRLDDGWRFKINGVTTFREDMGPWLIVLLDWLDKVSAATQSLFTCDFLPGVLSQVPVVFVMTDTGTVGLTSTESDEPQAVRIRQITTTGFQASVAEPTGSDGNTAGCWHFWGGVRGGGSNSQRRKRNTRIAVEFPFIVAEVFYSRFIRVNSRNFLRPKLEAKKLPVDRERTLVTGPGHSFFPTMPGSVGTNIFQYIAASVGIWDLNGFAVEVGASPTVFGDVRWCCAPPVCNMDVWKISKVLGDILRDHLKVEYRPKPCRLWLRGAPDDLTRSDQICRWYMDTYGDMSPNAATTWHRRPHQYDIANWSDLQALDLSKHRMLAWSSELVRGQSWIKSASSRFSIQSQKPWLQYKALDGFVEIPLPKGSALELLTNLRNGGHHLVLR